ncbi:hypothetical protein [Paenibacillus sp. YN15]|uniref:hypothetical protein n=1 Tax=Paenibacillus sp. YN15 TaxID=1742774 RepID=UPI00215C6906|nr:hypothetical protein [Paenibacillus sp. YN15]
MVKTVGMGKLRRIWTTVPRVWRLLSSSRVPLKEKLLFVVPAAVYWVVPDVLPLVPLDDIAVTLLLAGWFASRMEKKYGEDAPVLKK